MQLQAIKIHSQFLLVYQSKSRFDFKSYQYLVKFKIDSVIIMVFSSAASGRNEDHGENSSFNKQGRSFRIHLLSSLCAFSNNGCDAILGMRSQDEVSNIDLESMFHAIISICRFKEIGSYSSDHFTCSKLTEKFFFSLLHSAIATPVSSCGHCHRWVVVSAGRFSIG